MGLRPQTKTRKAQSLDKTKDGLSAPRQNKDEPKAQDKTKKKMDGPKPKTRQMIGLRPKTTREWA